jgi:hypothetical protein
MENRNNVIAMEQGAAALGRHSRNFSYPHQVVLDPNMDLQEKKAILAAWASDVHAVESLPALRHLPGTPFPVTFCAIMDARAQLDRLAGAGDDDEPTPPRPGAIKRLRARPLFQEAA